MTVIPSTLLPYLVFKMSHDSVLKEVQEQSASVLQPSLKYIRLWSLQ